MADERQRGAEGSPGEPHPVASQGERKPGTLSLLALVLFPFALMVAIAVFYYWISG